MEFIDKSSTTSHREPPEPENLLEECWFFGNLLIDDSKSKMSKSFSDFGPSSNYNTEEEMSVIRSRRSSSTTPKKHPKGDNFDRQKLARAPSLPIFMKPKVDMFDQVKEKHDSGGSNLRHQNNLIREKSLSPCIIRQEEEDEDEESEFTLGKLIRQASLNSSHILPSRHNSKAQSSSCPTKYRPIKRTEQLDSNNMDMRDQYLSETKIRRSSSDIQTKEVKIYKTLSYVQENCRDKTKEKMIKNYSPTIPKWCDNEKRSSQDMKADIKFWARAVASNVGAPSLVIANRN